MRPHSQIQGHVAFNQSQDGAQRELRSMACVLDGQRSGVVQYCMDIHATLHGYPSTSGWGIAQAPHYCIKTATPHMLNAEWHQIAVIFTISVLLSASIASRTLW